MNKTELEILRSANDTLTREAEVYKNRTCIVNTIDKEVEGG